MDLHKKRLQGEDVPDIYEMGAIHKNGERVDIETNSGIISYEGAPAVLLFIRDITERKKAEQELLYFKKAVQGSSDAIGMSTPDGKHYYQNEAFDRLFGLSVKDVEGEAGPLGWLGAVVVIVAIFLPGMLLMLIFLPAWNWLRARPLARAALAGVNAGVVGILAAALWEPVITSSVISPIHAAWAVGAFVAFTFLKLPAWAVVILSGAAGALVL